MITITINGQQYSHNATPAEEAALDAVWSARMGDLPPGEGQDSDTPISERPGYHATPAAYLQWAIAHSYTDGMDVAAVMAGALASWAGNPVEPSPDVPLSGEQLKTTLIAYAAEKRWRVATAGVIINGIPIPSDDTADARVRHAMADLADGVQTKPLTFVVGDIVVAANAAMFSAIRAAISQRWQTCYAVQGALVEGINDGTITSREQIDAANWPA